MGIAGMMRGLHGGAGDGRAGPGYCERRRGVVRGI